MRRPNVIWLVLDSLRADHLGCYGYTRDTTPNIDRLADESAVFTRAIAQGGYTFPTHVAMLTGSYFFEVPIKPGAGPRDHPTITTLLRDSGWSTACFSANPFLWDARGLARGFDHISRVSPLGSRRFAPGSGVGKAISMFRGHKAGFRIASQLVAWMQDAPKPAFVFANIMEPHSPYTAPRAHSRLCFPGLSGLLRYGRAVWRTRRPFEFAGAAAEEDIEVLIDLYDVSIATADAVVGECVEGLRRAGVLDDSILIITSDHGDFLGEGGRMNHVTGLGEALVRIPLIVRWPEAWSSRRIFDAVVEKRDLPYSLCDALNVSGLAASCRENANILQEPDDGPERFAFSERIPLRPKAGRGYRKRNPHFDWDRHDHDYTLIRTSEWELVRSTGDVCGLFRPEEDPAENHDLTDEHPEVAAQLNELMDRMCEYRRAYSHEVSDDEGSPDKQVEEHLKALGYL